LRTYLLLELVPGAGLLVEGLTCSWNWSPARVCWLRTYLLLELVPGAGLLVEGLTCSWNWVPGAGLLVENLPAPGTGPRCGSVG